MKKVLIIYRTLPQYRLEFYNGLRNALLQHNIELQLIYGDSHFDNRKDSAHLNWATFRKNKVYKFRRHSLIWQPCLEEIKEADLVIVEQANRLLLNYYLMLKRRFSKMKFAFWGHGLNLQIAEGSLFNKFKRTYITQSDWWFAYTQGIKNFLIEQGFAADKVTAVQNAIDTKSMHSEFKTIDEKEVAGLRSRWNLIDNEPVFIYCGAYYHEKRIDFLIEALDKLNNSGFAFKCFFVGSGPQSDLVNEAATSRPWLLNAGPKFGREKALYFKVADIFLHPGAMGLAILDSFAFDTPMITAQSLFHGPEFEYIVDGYNGVISSGALDDYVRDILELWSNKTKLNHIRSSFDHMLDEYSNEKMVANFCDGILKALRANKHAGVI